MGGVPPSEPQPQPQLPEPDSQPHPPEPPPQPLAPEPSLTPEPLTRAKGLATGGIVPPPGFGPDPQPHPPPSIIGGEGGGGTQMPGHLLAHGSKGSHAPQQRRPE